MRLPGDDINLVTDFCFTEGIIGSRDDLLSIRHCEAIPESAGCSSTWTGKDRARR